MIAPNSYFVPYGTFLLQQSKKIFLPADGIHEEDKKYGLLYTQRELTSFVFGNISFYRLAIGNYLNRLPLSTITLSNRSPKHQLALPINFSFFSFVTYSTNTRQTGILSFHPFLRNSILLLG